MIAMSGLVSPANGSTMSEGEARANAEWMVKRLGRGWTCGLADHGHFHSIARRGRVRVCLYDFFAVGGPLFYASVVGGKSGAGKSPEEALADLLEVAKFAAVTAEGCLGEVRSAVYGAPG